VFAVAVAQRTWIRQGSCRATTVKATCDIDTDRSVRLDLSVPIGPILGRAAVAHRLAHLCCDPLGMSHIDWTSSQTIEQVSDSRRTIWMLYRGLLIRRFWVQVAGGAPYKTR